MSSGTSQTQNEAMPGRHEYYLFALGSFRKMEDLDIDSWMGGIRGHMLIVGSAPGSPRKE